MTKKPTFVPAPRFRDKGSRVASVNALAFQIASEQAQNRRDKIWLLVRQSKLPRTEYGRENALFLTTALGRKALRNWIQEEDAMAMCTLPVRASKAELISYRDTVDSAISRLVQSIEIARDAKTPEL